MRKRSAFFSRFLLIFIFSIIPLHLPDFAYSQSSDPLLQKLDSHYYYPSQLGLKNLTAKIKWLQKDLAASPPKFIAHPEVLFHWDADSDARTFQIAPRSIEMTEAKKEEVKQFFLNYREAILPRSLKQMLSGFKLNGTSKSQSWTVAEYQSLRTQDEIQKYILYVDPKKRRISKFDIERKTPPYKVSSHFRYIQKEGQWLVSESRARFESGRDSYSETTSYIYRKVLGIWLPAKINQVLKKGRDEVSSYRFLLSEYQVNSPHLIIESPLQQKPRP